MFIPRKYVVCFQYVFDFYLERRRIANTLGKSRSLQSHLNSSDLNRLSFRLYYIHILRFFLIDTLKMTSQYPYLNPRHFSILERNLASEHLGNEVQVVLQTANLGTKYYVYFSHLSIYLYRIFRWLVATISRISVRCR